MKFDLTKEIKLNGRELRIYRTAQVALFIFALVIFFGAILLVLFPSYKFAFDFSTPDSKKNSITNLKNEEEKFISQGKVKAEKDNFFEVSLAGIFSKIEVSFGLNKKANNFSAGEIRVRKGYTAFFAPIDLPYSFNDGSLLQNGGSYYLVSGQSLRKFENIAALEALGFSKDSFEEVLDKDLGLNKVGETIKLGDAYPDSSLIAINGDYYIFNGGKLDKFLSEKAFLSRFSKEKTILKDESFLEKYPVSNNVVGFANGSLIAYGESAFVVDEENILPIESAETFQAFGFSWDDLISVNGDEFSFYPKGNLFKIDSIHPDNTVFRVAENGNYYLYKNKALHLIPSEKAAKTWSKRAPIVVSEKNLSETSQCNLKKSGILFPKYLCEAKIENLANFSGKDYEVNFSFETDTNVDTIQTILSKDLTWKNLRFSISEIIRRIKLTYVK